MGKWESALKRSQGLVGGRDKMIASAAASARKGRRGSVLKTQKKGAGSWREGQRLRPVSFRWKEPQSHHSHGLRAVAVNNEQNENVSTPPQGIFFF